MYHDIDFSKIEDSSFEDRFYVGFQGLESDGQGFQAVYNHIFVKTGEIVSIALFVVILSIHQPLIAFICIVTILISSLSNYLYSNYSHKKEDEVSHAYRQASYFNDKLSDFAYGKDIRVFSLKDFLINKYQTKSMNYIKVINDINKHKFKYGFFELIALLIKDGISYFLIIKAYYY